MSLLEPELTIVPDARLGKWFLLSGLIGVALGLLLFIPPLFNMLGDAVFVIFPSSIMGLAEPQTKSDVALLLSMEFTSQFLLYGIIGLGLGACIHAIRKFFIRSPAERNAE